MFTRTLKPVLVTLLLAASPLALAGKAAETLTLGDPYVRLVPPGTEQTAAYLTLRNADKIDHALVKAASPAARSVELHTVVMKDGMMEMRPVSRIEIKAGGEAKLQPGGFHIMLIGLTHPLKEGAAVPLTLTFEDGSTKPVTATVKAIADTMPMSMPMHGHQ